MLKQKKDDNGSPVFSFQVVLEGVEGEKGTGFSKKEAQQLASKETLQRLKREPQFVDAIFAAKTERTKMEEEPAVAVPDTEQEQNFIIEQPKEEVPVATESTETAPKRVRKEKTPKTDAQTASAEDTDEKFFAERSDLVDYDLSDISHKEKSREDIIAEAEAAAFEEM